MNIYLAKLASFQIRCYRKILQHIENGERHISVLMSAGSGKKTISYCLSKTLSCEKKILYVTEYQHIASNIRRVLSVMELDIEVCTISNIESIDISKYNVIFMMGLGVFARKYMTEVCKHFDGVTVSFGAPYQETTDEIAYGRTLEYTGYLNNVAFVYTTKTVVDIRDAVDAEPEEREYLCEQIRKQKNEHDEEGRLSLLKIEAVSAEKKGLEERISSRVKLLIEMTEAKRRENELEEARAELERMRREAKEREDELEKLIKKNEELKRKSEFQEQLLISVGVAAEVVQEMYEKIERARKELLSELESSDEEIQEKAMHKLQNVVTDLIYEETKNFVNISSKRYEEILVFSLTERVWKEQLSNKSRSFLITAKANFDSLSKNPNIYDYSGVCLLVTKALEVEVTKRFYHEYLDYLNTETPDISQWPESVRQRRGYQVLDEVITEEQFMLGSLVPFMGIKRLTDNNGNVTGYRIRSQVDYNKFVDFAMDRLFSGLSRTTVIQKLEQDYLFIEKVRVDYRNPAAHKNALTAVSAEECIKYVIETQKMLRRMLIDMCI